MKDGNGARVRRASRTRVYRRIDSHFRLALRCVHRLFARSLARFAVAVAGMNATGNGGRDDTRSDRITCK